jgi:hypothetical protein
MVTFARRIQFVARLLLQWTPLPQGFHGASHSIATKVAKVKAPLSTRVLFIRYRGFHKTISVAINVVTVVHREVGAAVSRSQATTT